MGYPVHLVSDVTSSSGANDGPRAGSRDAMQSAHQSEDQLRDLMVRYQQGDVAAVETLVTNLSPALLRFCSGPGMSPSDAEDVLQDCWLRIHRARHTYLPSEPLLPWIFAVARHTRLDAYRRRRRLGSREVLVAGTPEPAGAAPAPGSGVMELVNRLPDGQREVIVMLKVVGMSLEEVARATSSTAGAIKQKAHRAYGALRSMLAAEGPG
ncbi:MAG TPA: RNA polymerase sigma factor [Terriglobales bacterium]|nr:RNA polymerase sigma factor [Terriglobales bacterium]